MDVPVQINYGINLPVLSCNICRRYDATNFIVMLRGIWRQFHKKKMLGIANAQPHENCLS